MFSWIPVKVVAEARKALDWLEEKQRLQGTLRKTDDPVLTAADIKKREDTIVRFADPILSKPAPPPPKVRGASLTLLPTQLFSCRGLAWFGAAGYLANTIIPRSGAPMPK